MDEIERAQVFIVGNVVYVSMFVETMGAVLLYVAPHGGKFQLVGDSDAGIQVYIPNEVREWFSGS